MTERDPLREALKDDAEYRRHAATDADSIREALIDGARGLYFDPDPPLAAFARMEARLHTLEDAGRAVVNEWNWPDEDPPSETYFHALVETLHAALAAAGEKP